MRRLAEESAGLGLTVAAIDISGSQVSDARPFALAKGRLWDTRRTTVLESSEESSRFVSVPFYTGDPRQSPSSLEEKTHEIESPDDWHTTSRALRVAHSPAIGVFFDRFSFRLQIQAPLR